MFDTNDNGEISTKEISKASTILKGLDRNRDGVLTHDELPRPPRPDNDRQGQDNGPLPRRGQNGGDRNNGGNRNNALRNAPAGSVVFTGGYQTDRRDNGRPVILIAAALGVKSEVFRDAFSRVTPERGGNPSAALVRRNKTVLMTALGKYGITNDRLDAVSNQYRYRPQEDDVWSSTPATAKAITKNGKVTSFTIVNAGSGYSTSPIVRIVGNDNVYGKTTLGFSKDFKTNGRVVSITLVNGRAPSQPARGQGGDRTDGPPPRRGDRDQARPVGRPALEK